jgi:hypothetical protein
MSVVTPEQMRTDAVAEIRALIADVVQQEVGVRNFMKYDDNSVVVRAQNGAWVRIEYKTTGIWE